MEAKHFFRAGQIFACITLACMGLTLLASQLSIMEETSSYYKIGISSNTVDLGPIPQTEVAQKTKKPSKPGKGSKTGTANGEGIKGLTYPRW